MSLKNITGLFIFLFSWTGSSQTLTDLHTAKKQSLTHEYLIPIPGHGITFYESNPTYYDAKDDTGDWVYALPEERGMNSSLLEEGLDELKHSPFLCSVLILRNNAIVVERYFNGSDFHQSNNIHSASKSILSALIGIAIQHGYIESVHQKVVYFLPEYFPRHGLKRDITIHHLMTLSAGLMWKEDDTEYSIEHTSSWVRSILKLPLVQSPGMDFNYSTGLTHILSAVITRATGMSTSEFAHQNLFIPIGITIEHWGKDPQNIFSGGYNLYITPREMAKFGLLALQNGTWGGQQIVPPWILSESFLPHMKVDSEFNYGYNWWLREISGYHVYLAWGFGGQYIYLIPELDLVFVTTADTRENDDGIEINEYRFVRRFVIPSITSVNP